MPRTYSMMNNHLKNKYSNLVFWFLYKYKEKINIDMSVLDVGCGHYRNLKLFNDLGFKKLYGIDMQHTENPLNVEIDFIKGNIEFGLPFLEQEFDIVLCNFVLMFIDPGRQFFVLDELMRVTKKYLVFETYRQRKNFNGFIQEYDFKMLVDYLIQSNKFTVLRKRMYDEQIVLERK